MAIGKVIKGDGLAESVVVATSERPALRPPRAGVMNAEVFEARQGAQGIIEDAQRERERILAEAQREKEELFAKARDLGRQEGIAQATELLLRAKMPTRRSVGASSRMSRDTNVEKAWATGDRG